MKLISAAVMLHVSMLAAAQDIDKGVDGEGRASYPPEPCESGSTMYAEAPQTVALKRHRPGVGKQTSKVTREQITKPSATFSAGWL